MSTIEGNVSPKVSVAMITYNHEAYIKQAIESILSQKTTFKIELVIGEDLSTDGTRKICEGYAKKFPDIIKLQTSERNLGVTPNFIRTLKACNGKYVATCEGDDYWDDITKLQQQVDFLETNRNFVACYHTVKVIDSNGITIKDSKSFITYKRDASSNQLMMGQVLSLASLCFRNVISEYPEEMCKSPTGDNFLCSLLGNYGDAKFISEIKPSAYRMHSGGIWSLQNDSKKKMTLLLSFFWLWQYYNRIEKPEIAYKFYRRILLEGFYSNPFEGWRPQFLAKAELRLIKLIRKIFRWLRWFFNRKMKDKQNR